MKIPKTKMSHGAGSLAGCTPNWSPRLAILNVANMVAHKVKIARQ